MSSPRAHYESKQDDSSRWDGFPYRDGDIVVSTRSKSGTTWTQMMCALLVFQTPELPRPLGEITPWIDHKVHPLEEVLAGVEAQRHRRILKTHTPLDGIPIDPRVTYVVTARNPLDMAKSFYHHGQNIDRERVRELLGPPAPGEQPPSQRSLHDFMIEWIGNEPDPHTDLESLTGVLHHIGTAWERRDEPNVVLLHYTDLKQDLSGQMSYLAGRLGITVPEELLPDLVKAATFEEMKSNAEDLVPNRDGIFKDSSEFFHAGGAERGKDQLSADELADYERRITSLASPELVAWLNR